MTKTAIQKKDAAPRPILSFSLIKTTVGSASHAVSEARINGSVQGKIYLRKIRAIAADRIQYRRTRRVLLSVLLSNYCPAPFIKLVCKYNNIQKNGEK